MGNTVRIHVDKNLKEVLEELRKKIAFDLKKQYNLERIDVARTLSSQILAAKMKGQKFMNIKIRRTSLNTGILELK